jgi:glycosyltransferase involved in cell wall biosynthesis
LINANPTPDVTGGLALSDRSAVAERPDVPSVFLMIQTLETGGSERQFSGLVNSLDRSRFAVHLGCIRRRGNFLVDLGEMPEFPLGGSLYGMQSIRSRLRLSRHLRSQRIAIAHAFDLYANLTLIPAARLAGVPVVIGSQRQLGDLLAPGHSRAQHTAFRLCDAIICNSRAAAERLAKQGLPQHKVAVIGNGLPASAFASTGPALPRRAGVLRVGMIARMNTLYKNHLQFLRAAARIHSRFPEVEFVLVGDGPLRAGLEHRAMELGLGKQANFLGDRRDIPAILASLDISVLPSTSESLSNVILESMAAGLPVVATDVGGNAELLDRRTGCLIPPHKEDALVAAIEGLLHDANQRRELGQNAKQSAFSRFSTVQTQTRHEELYSELLEKKGWKGNRRNYVLPVKKRIDGKRLRVVFVAPSLRYVGGQSVQADLLLRNWRNDQAVEAKLVPIDPVFPRGFGWIEKIPFLRTLIREPLYLWSLWCNLEHADVVHIFSASYWSFLVAPAPAWWLSSLRGKNALIHYHSGEARDHLKRFRSARPILSKAELIVPSQYLVDVFREFGLSAQAAPNIVDLSQFSYRTRTPLRPHLVCTRGFHPYYCIDDVVRAFAEVKKEFPNAELDLVGKGPSQGQIVELVQRLGISGVNFCGVASRQAIGSFYDRADIFINASKLDNMPVSVLEAFASGTPVVTSAPEGMSYIVDHERTGLLSAVGDFRALANNVMRLLREPGLAERISGSAFEESRKYRWDQVRQQWLEVYRSLQP